MFRRNFLQLLAFSSAGAIAPLEALEVAACKTVIYHVKGFSCVTCAVGLDSILSQQKGVQSSKSTYPEGKVTIVFHPGVISEGTIQTLIAEMGFTVDDGRKA